MAVMGIETEYGISAPDAPELTPEELSAAVVLGYPGAAVGGEPDESAALRLDLLPNRFLGNGARLYVDHAHPEYSSPEVTSALAGVCYDLAGDEVLRAGARAASDTLGVEVRIVKNNTDGKGSSYGFHENYLVRRETPWARLVEVFIPFVVSRVPLIGAGRVGLGQHGHTAGFQLSQRADFFEAEVGLETTVRRPLMNTRDEPLADARRWRRLHVISGDANRSHTSSWLKLGTAAAVLRAADADALGPPRLADPLTAVRQVSRDVSCRTLLPLADGRRLTALDLQEIYLDQVARAGTADEALLQAWATTIDDLRADPARCADRLDWVAKLAVLESYRRRDGLDWSAPRLAQVDLHYADLDERRSVYSALVRAGRMRVLVPDEAVADAVAAPPADTRAHLRGRLVTEHADRVLALNWDSALVTSRTGRPVTLRMPEPLRQTRADVGDLLDSLARTGELPSALLA